MPEHRIYEDLNRKYPHAGSHLGEDSPSYSIRGASSTDTDQWGLPCGSSHAVSPSRREMPYITTPSKMHFNTWTPYLVLDHDPTPYLMGHNDLQQAALTVAAASVVYALYRKYSRPSVKDIPGPPNPSWVHGRVGDLLTHFFVWITGVRRSPMVLADSRCWCR